MILGWGLTLALPGDTFEAFPAYRLLAARMNESQWATMLLLIGTIRCVALIVNGRLPLGTPIARCVTSFIGALIWSQFFASFLDYSVRAGALSGNITVYLVLCASDVFSCGRSAWDFSRRWRSRQWR